MRLDTRIKVPALSTELAVFTAIAEFGGQDAAKSDPIAVEVTPDLVSGVEKIVKGLPFESKKGASLVSANFAVSNNSPSKGKKVGNLRRHRCISSESGAACQPARRAALF
jgi:hypothetical protein